MNILRCCRQAKSIRSQVDCDRPRLDPLGTLGALFKSLSVVTDRCSSRPHRTPLNLSHTDHMTSSTFDSTLGPGGEPAADTGPIPMSFPAILRAPRLADRFAHLRLASVLEDPTSDPAKLAIKKNKREDREGKRWIRRKENCMFHCLNGVAQKAL